MGKPTASRTRNGAAYQLADEQSVGYPEACGEQARGQAAAAAAFTARRASARYATPTSSLEKPSPQPATEHT